MNTKNKRKYQNKPAQRSAPRSVAPAPKFKDKKEKFLKETLPCIVLLIFMAFWSIGSALSIIDKIKQRQMNTSMITANADTPSYNEGVITFTLDGFRSLYFVETDGINLCNDVFTVYIDTIQKTFTLTTLTDSVTVSSSSDVSLDVSFMYLGGSFDVECDLHISCSDLSRITSVDYIRQIDYSYYSTGPLAVMWTRSLLYFDVYFTRSIEDYGIAALSSYYSSYFDTTNSQEIQFLNERITQLQVELGQARNELTASESIVDDLESNIVSLENTILNLRNEVQRLQGLVNSNYQLGFNDGKEVGRYEGIASANNYSFLSLIGAVVDAPVKTFTGLFDWNLLGINLKQFFLSILSLMTILMAVKLIMR